MNLPSRGRRRLAGLVVVAVLSVVTAAAADVLEAPEWNPVRLVEAAGDDWLAHQWLHERAVSLHRTDELLIAWESRAGSPEVRGLMWALLGRFHPDEGVARRFLDQAVSLEPRALLAGARRALAREYSDDEDYSQRLQEARRLAAEAVRRSPEDPFAWWLSGDLADATRASEGIVAYRRAASLAGSDSGLCMALATDISSYADAVSESEEEGSGAHLATLRGLSIESYRRALGADRRWGPRSPAEEREACRFHLACTLLAPPSSEPEPPAADADEATRLLREILAGNPSHDQARETLARRMARAGELESARALMREAPQPEGGNRLLRSLQDLADMAAGRHSVSSRADGEVLFRVRSDRFADGPVWVTGDFDQWQEHQHRLRPAHDGWLEVALRLPPGRYRYEFRTRSEHDAAELLAPDVAEGAPAFVVAVDGRVRESAVEPFELALFRARSIPAWLAPKQAREKALEALRLRPGDARALDAWLVLEGTAEAVGTPPVPPERLAAVTMVRDISRMQGAPRREALEAAMAAGAATPRLEAEWYLAAPDTPDRLIWALDRLQPAPSDRWVTYAVHRIVTTTKQFHTLNQEAARRASPALHKILADRHRQNGASAPALLEAERYARGADQDSRAIAYAIGLRFELLGASLVANRELRDALVRFPFSASLQDVLGENLSQLDDLRVFMDLLQAQGLSGGGGADRLRSFALLAQRRGLLALAEGTLTKARMLEPTWADLAHRQGCVLLETMQYTLAAKALQEAVDHGLDQDDHVLQQLSAARWHRGEHAAAISLGEQRLGSIRDPLFQLSLRLDLWKALLDHSPDRTRALHHRHEALKLVRRVELWSEGGLRRGGLLLARVGAGRLDAEMVRVGLSTLAGTGALQVLLVLRLLWLATAPLILMVLLGALVLRNRRRWFVPVTGFLACGLLLIVYAAMVAVLAVAATGSLATAFGTPMSGVGALIHAAPAASMLWLGMWIVRALREEHPETGGAIRGSDLPTGGVREGGASPGKPGDSEGREQAPQMIQRYGAPETWSWRVPIDLTFDLLRARPGVLLLLGGLFGLAEGMQQSGMNAGLAAVYQLLAFTGTCVIAHDYLVEGDSPSLGELRDRLKERRQQQGFGYTVGLIAGLVGLAAGFVLFTLSFSQWAQAVEDPSLARRLVAAFLGGSVCIYIGGLAFLAIPLETAMTGTGLVPALRRIRKALRDRPARVRVLGLVGMLARLGGMGLGLGVVSLWAPQDGLPHLVTWSMGAPMGPLYVYDSAMVVLLAAYSTYAYLWARGFEEDAPGVDVAPVGEEPGPKAS